MTGIDLKEKAVALLKSFSDMTGDAFAAEADPSFHYQLVPDYMGRPRRDLENYRQHMKKAFSTIQSYSMTSKAVYEDTAQRAVIVHATMVMGIKDRGTWTVDGVFFFQFTEEAKVIELREFPDTKQADAF